MKNDVCIELPTPAQVRQARMDAGLTQQVTAKFFGLALNSWQARETSGSTSRKTSVAEWNYLLLLADKHPVRIELPTPAQVRQARMDAGLTQSATAKLFGIGLTSWQKREGSGNDRLKTSVAEWNYLLLLADKLPGGILPSVMTPLI